MTESTSLPAARPRKILTQIAPVTWEHPADRAALQSLRSVPGFDEVVKKIYGFIGERGVRLIFQADAVRVGPTQFPRLNQLYTDILTSMDWPERPELFVSQTPFANAGAFGMDRPFIVINSGTLKLLDDDEVRNVLGHELGHVMSGHAHPADPARPARVVPQERALVRPRRAAGVPGSDRVAAREPQVRGGRRH